MKKKNWIQKGMEWREFDVHDDPPSDIVELADAVAALEKRAIAANVTILVGGMKLMPVNCVYQRNS